MTIICFMHSISYIGWDFIEKVSMISMLVTRLCLLVVVILATILAVEVMVVKPWSVPFKCFCCSLFECSPVKLPPHLLTGHTDTLCWVGSKLANYFYILESICHHKTQIVERFFVVVTPPCWHHICSWFGKTRGQNFPWFMTQGLV